MLKSRCVNFHHNVSVSWQLLSFDKSAICYYKLYSKFEKLDLCNYSAAATARALICINVLAVILFLPLLKKLPYRILPWT